MTDRLLEAHVSPLSSRMAAIGEEGDSVWLCLTKPGSMEPEVMSWLLNTPNAPREPTREPYRSLRQAPPLPFKWLVPGGIRSDWSEAKWSLQWSDEGHTVAALFDGQVIGVVKGGIARGWARFVREGAGAWAKPFSDREFPLLHGARPMDQ